jgi:hypothetical protein
LCWRRFAAIQTVRNAGRGRVAAIAHSPWRR